MPTELRALSLDFANCDIGSSGALTLAENLPQNLSTLGLHFDRCNFSDGSVRTVAERVPPTLSSLSLTFGAGGIGEDGALAVAEFLPVGLTSLSISFLFCRIGDAGARALAARVPETLSSLSLSFPRCNIGEGGARAVAERVHRFPCFIQGEATSRYGWQRVAYKAALRCTALHIVAHLCAQAARRPHTGRSHTGCKQVAHRLHISCTRAPVGVPVGTVRRSAVGLRAVGLLCRSA